MVPSHVVLGRRTPRFSLPYLLPFLPVEPIFQRFAIEGCTNFYSRRSVVTLILNVSTFDVRVLLSVTAVW
jgi:hypothetical protein